MGAEGTIYQNARDVDTLGGRLWRAREAAGLSASRCARMMGVRKETLDGWESDRSEPRANRLITMAGILQVSPAWLLHGLGEAPQIDGVSDELKILKAQVQRLKELRAQTDMVMESIESAVERIAKRDMNTVGIDGLHRWVRAFM